MQAPFSSLRWGCRKSSRWGVRGWKRDRFTVRFIEDSQTASRPRIQPLRRLTSAYRSALKWHFGFLSPSWICHLISLKCKHSRVKKKKKDAQSIICHLKFAVAASQFFFSWYKLWQVWPLLTLESCVSEDWCQVLRISIRNRFSMWQTHIANVTHHRLALFKINFTTRAETSYFFNPKETTAVLCLCRSGSFVCSIVWVPNRETTRRLWMTD